MIDEVMIYNRVLTEDEVSSLHNNTLYLISSEGISSEAVLQTNATGDYTTAEYALYLIDSFVTIAWKI